MNFLPRPFIAASLALLVAAPSQAALIQVAMSGFTDNTEVQSGDPCLTGTTGPNACNSQLIVMNVVIDTGTAPADTNAAANLGNYRSVTSPGYMTATATINGNTFVAPLAMNVDHTVDIYDNLDAGGFGILDRVQFLVAGVSPGFVDSFTIFPNVLMTSGAFSGDALDVLGDIVGSPLAVSGNLSLSNGSFNLRNGTGSVVGQYRLSSVAFSTAVVPAPPALWLLGTAVAGLMARRLRRT